MKGKEATGFSLVMLMAITACQTPSAATEKPELEDSTIALDGAQLSLQYCSACHAYPEPSLLDRPTWQRYILPRMGYLMGIYPHDSVRTSLIEAGQGGIKVQEANVFPQKPLLSPDRWEAISDYYLAHAPAHLDPAPKEKVSEGLKNFTVKIPPYRLSPPSTTLVATGSNKLWIGDAHTRRLYQFDAQMQLQGAANVREGAVSLDENKEGLRLTVMGSFSPTDNPSGFVMALPDDKSKRPHIVLDTLQRPVHTAYADLDGDGQEDIITCEFAKWTGCLSWWKNRNGRYEKHVLRNKPGATRAYVRDFNQNGLPDVMALFGQGDEGIFVYYNQGNGEFREETVLRFPPSYGSSYFGLFDMDADGDEDIIYTAGDNADYPPVMKPYHGIRIFLNDGKNQYRERFFYPLHGAYRAIPADFDLDGDTDIAAISFFPDFQHTPQQGFVYLENQGNFNFEAYTFPEATRGRWLVMDTGDIDQDGDQDIVLGSLAFEVVPPTPLLEQWIEEGIPFVVLENTVR